MAVPDRPRKIVPSQAELQKNAFSSTNLQSALEALHQDGLVILKSVVDVGHVDLLNEAMCQEAEAIVSRYADDATKYNHNVRSNILQAPPLTRQDLLFEDVYFNPFVLQIANAYLGTPPTWNFCSGNNALPHTATLRQPVHKDLAFPNPQCPFYFIANIPLVDFTPANGATEFWLGTHAHTTGAEHKSEADDEGSLSCFVREELVEARREVRPPVRLEARKGDVAIRDIRVWHAGMPNPSGDHRVMVAFGYQAPWYPNFDMRLALPRSQFAFFQERRGVPVEVRADFLGDEEVERVMHRDDFRIQPTAMKEKVEVR